MLTWQQLASLAPSELANYDIALTNLACAAGLPGVQSGIESKYLQMLKEMARRVGRETERHEYRFERNPEQYENSHAFFKLLFLANVLHQDFGVGYNKELKLKQQKGEEFPHTVESLFLHGILDGKGGSCASLPILYLAVGRRLGYPLKLVATHCHWFVRWDEPVLGERINMECSGDGGFSSFPDEHYLKWPFAVTARQVKLSRYLECLSPLEKLAVCLQHRGDCWADAGDCHQAFEALATSFSLVPENLWYRDRLAYALNRKMDQLQPLFPPNFPKVGFRPLRRWYPGIPLDLEHGIIQTEIYDALLKTQREPHRSWWEALRRSPKQRPAHVPSVIEIEQIDKTLAYHRGAIEAHNNYGGCCVLTVSGPFHSA